jgi:hypothetical protein
MLCSSFIHLKDHHFPTVIHTKLLLPPVGLNRHGREQKLVCRVGRPVSIK